MRIRIKDIAQKAGVSIGTVDRVLHDRSGVSPDTRSKVLALIDELGYEPSKVAQALVAQSRNMKIGVIYPDAELHFWGDVLSAIVEERERLEPYGIEIVTETTTTYNYLEQLSAIKSLVDQGVNGIAMMPYDPTAMDRVINDLFDKGILFAHFVSDAQKSKRVFFCGLDNVRSGSVAAALMKLFLGGKGRIAVIGVHRQVQCINDRVLGFVNKIEESSSEMEIVTVYNLEEKPMDSEIEYKTLVLEACESILQNTKNLDGIYITNSLTYCVSDVLEKYGLLGKVKIIGHERGELNTDALKKERIQGLVYQNQCLEVVDAIRYLAHCFTEGVPDMPEIRNVPTHILLKENAV